MPIGGRLMIRNRRLPLSTRISRHIHRLALRTILNRTIPSASAIVDMDDSVATTGMAASDDMASSPATTKCVTSAATNTSNSAAADDMARASHAVKQDESSAVVDMVAPSAPIDMNVTLSAAQLEALDGIAIGELLFVTETLPGLEYENYEDDDDMEVIEGREPDEDEDEDGGSANDGAEDHDENEGADGEEAEFPRLADARTTGNEVDEGCNTGGASSSREEIGEEEEQDEDEPNTSSDDTAIPYDAECPPRMFVVTAIIRNERDEVTSIMIKDLKYSRIVDLEDHHSYQIYGNDIIHRHPPTCKCPSALHITDVLNDEKFHVLRSPQGDFVSWSDRTISSNLGGQCTSGCSNGWLDNREEVNSLIANHDSPVLAWAGDLDGVVMQETICPICIGIELFKDQERLQHTLITTGRINLDEVLTHEGELNARRRELGYPFTQFDERLWGFHFNDMDDEGMSEFEYDGGWDDPYEHFPEAMDPNAHIKTSPASEATIQALPRKPFGATSEDASKCCVCMETLKEDSVVILLPCGHAEHHAECLELWLRQQETCTVCRRVVPAAKEVIVPMTEVDEVDGDDHVEEQEDDEEEEGENMNEALDEEYGMESGSPDGSRHSMIANTTIPSAVVSEQQFSSSWQTEDTAMWDGW